MNKDCTSTAMDTLENIMTEFQKAGGNVAILKGISLFDFIKCCATNNIELKAKYTSNTALEEIIRNSITKGKL